LVDGAWTFAKAAGFRYQSSRTCGSPWRLKGDPFQAGADNRVSDWAEMLILEGAQPWPITTIPFSESIRPSRVTTSAQAR